MTLSVGIVGNRNNGSSSNKVAFGARAPKLTTALPTFEVVDPKLWMKCTKKRDGFSKAIVKFAADWANLMETEMSEGLTLGRIARLTYHRTARENNISGAMVGIATDILTKVWKHGEALKNWHNAQSGVKKGAQGVVNPAILTIKAK